MLEIFFALVAVSCYHRMVSVYLLPASLETFVDCNAQDCNIGLSKINSELSSFNLRVVGRLRVHGGEVLGIAVWIWLE
jgi:hypothetical protein